MKNEPIITVKIKEVSLQGYVGPDMRMTTEVKQLGPPIEFEEKTKGKFICQQSWNGTYPAKAVVQITTVEKDPKFDDLGPDKDLELNASTALPYPNTINGNQSVSINLDAVGGDKGKKAIVAISFDWFLSPNLRDVIAFIVIQTKANLISSEFKQIKKLYETSQHLKKSSLNLLMTADPEWASMENFAKLVGNKKPWDYKQLIKNQWGEYQLDASKGKLYYHDILGNFHFGYIGRAIGFSKLLLLNSAGLAQGISQGISKATLFSKLAEGTLGELDNPFDQAAIKVGMNYWESYGSTMTEKTLLESLRHNHAKLNVLNAPEGEPPDQFKD